MTYEQYTEVKNMLDTLNWAEYAYNLDLLLLEIKNRMNLTDEDMLDYKGYAWCESENEHELGFLKGYDCSICKNRGYNNFHEVRNGKIYYFVRDCTCKKIRNEFQHLEQCGISKKKLEKYTFDNYKANDAWRLNYKTKALVYLEDFHKDPENFNKWFVVSGLSGVGKTHLCTAIYIDLLKSGKRVKYMPWKAATDELLQLKKSTYMENQKKYQKEMQALKTVDVLYIDDLFKLFPTSDFERKPLLDIAFMILDARSQNELITIISTEEMQEDIGALDIAICGRIKDGCKRNKTESYWAQIKKDPSRNYRMNNTED